MFADIIIKKAVHFLCFKKSVKITFGNEWQQEVADRLMEVEEFTDAGMTPDIAEQVVKKVMADVARFIEKV
jgi:hypothetical protein